MTTRQVVKWLRNVDQYLDPPGCEREFVSLPNKEQSCCTVGIVHEHRFAFFFWAMCAHENPGHHPILITLDSHDDTGVPSEVVPEDLDNLDISDRMELGLFAWLRLRSLNDGHILPALYLNFFSDVYVLQSWKQDSPKFQSPIYRPPYRDRAGKMHTLRFYRDVHKLLQDLPSDSPVYLDIDLDFFAFDKLEGNSLLGSQRLMSDAEISSILSLQGPFMGQVLNRLVGLTIALEPRYCGGLHNSLHIFDILNCEFFNGTLCTDSCRWRERVKQGT